MVERKRKKKERYQTWLASLSPEDRAFWDSFPEVNINDFQTPEQQKAWDSMPTEWGKEPPLKGHKRRKYR